MGEEFGPFHVEARQILGLGKNFAPFVAELLRCESTLYGHLDTLGFTENQSARDGGVDVLITGYTATSEWIPLGSSVWQLKSADLAPGEITTEFTGATYARDEVAKGAAYRLLLGSDPAALEVKRRKDALIEAAKECGYITSTEDENKFQLLTASQIASWTQKFPSLAVSHVLGGRGSQAVDFKTWSSRDAYKTKWHTDEKRDLAISCIVSQLDAADTPTVRVSGKSGVGKTRLVMEALRNKGLSSIVIYVFASDLTSDFLNHLVDPIRNRRAILVVDDCDLVNRKKVEDTIRTGSSVRAILIETENSLAPSFDVVPVDATQRSDLEGILKENTSHSSEIRRFVLEHSAGNIKQALWMCKAIDKQPQTPLSNLLRPDFISSLIGSELPEGQEYLAACLLALLPRVGWDLDLASEMQLLSRCFSIRLEVFANVEIKLLQMGILETEGRYRKIVTHPVAVFLATTAWHLRASDIEKNLIPTLSGAMEAGFYERMADLGDHFELSLKALQVLLNSNADFSSLASIEATGKSEILSTMALVAPELVSSHLGGLIRAAAASELEARTGVRRGLVFTLTKLVWHSRIFVESADNLLLLALAENESWANNATGTWTELFASVLPSTSASPEKRVEYLIQKCEDPDPRVLLLTVEAAQTGLDAYSSSMVDGELQRGVLVEPRGMTQTLGEMWSYQVKMIEILKLLANHPEPKVALAARAALVQAIHSSLTFPVVGTALAEAIKEVASSNLLQSTHIEIQHLENLYPPEKKSFAARREGLELFKVNLPSMSDDEELLVLVKSNSWDFADGILCARLSQGFKTLPPEEQLAFLDKVLSIVALPAAYDLGRALAVCRFDLLGQTRLLHTLFTNNSMALIGFLLKRVEDGESSAFDDFLSQDNVANESPEQKYVILTQAPISEVAWNRATELLSLLPPAFTGRYGIQWLSKMTEEQIYERLKYYHERVTEQPDQADYNAILEYASQSLRDKTTLTPEMQDLLWRLVKIRQQLPDVGRNGWTWSHVAKAALTNQTENLAALILELISADSVHPHGEEDELKLLKKCMESKPEVVFNLVATLLLGNDWRVSWAVKGWISSAVPAPVIISWIGSDVTRAQIIARVCEIGSDAPSELAVYLLSTFPDDEQIASDLYGVLYSGSFSGNASSHLQSKIDRIKGWLSIPGLDQAVAKWAQGVISSMSKDRESELAREAEGR